MKNTNKDLIFNNASSIAKYLELNIDELYKIFFNMDEAIDEEGIPYKEVYTSEINSFLCRVESSIARFEKKDLFINENTLNYVIIDNWNCGINNNYKKADLEQFISNLLKNIYSQKTDSESLKLKDIERDCLKSLLYSEFRNKLMFLSGYALQDVNDCNYKMYLKIKEIDEERADRIIKDTILEYKNICNIQYKLFTCKPTGDLKTIHDNVCSILNIRRNEFVF